MTIECPCCGSVHSTLHLRITAQDAASHFISPDEDRKRNSELTEHISQLWGGEISELRDCSNCEYGFSWPFIAGDKDFYELAYPRVSYPRMKWEFQRTCKELQESAKLDPDARVLELGAGDGFFLDLICPKFLPQGQAVATEYNGSARERLSSKGYITLNGDDYTTMERSAPFDSMFFFQVLEHMDNVVSLFDWAERNLKPGGHLFIGVPNKNRSRFYEIEGSLRDCPPNHVGSFTKKTFQTLATKTGFKTVAVETEPFSLKQFAKSDLYFSHRRRSQQAGSVAGSVRSLKNPRLRRTLILSDALLALPLRLPVWARASVTTVGLGGSTWAHLQKG